MRELPRQLSVEELAELFEGRTRFVELLAERDDPLQCAPAVIAELSDAEKREVLDAHPAIGQTSGLSAPGRRPSREPTTTPTFSPSWRASTRRTRRGTDSGSWSSSTGAPKSEILEVLRGRIGNPTDAELETALGELVAIATDRWRRG